MWHDNYKWHYNYIDVASESGFAFEKNKSSNLDRNKLCLINIESIVKEKDLLTIERHIPSVVHYELDVDQSTILDNNFVKLFKIGQLAIEYLLFCKKYLDHSVILLKEEIGKLNDENSELKSFIEELESHITVLTEKMNITFKCDQCSKIFSTETYLNSHMKRRHCTNSESVDNNDNSLHLEIKKLKERLNSTEKLIMHEKEKEESNQKEEIETSEKLTHNKNKQLIDEMQLKFDNFKDQMQDELKSLQTQKTFFEGKYLQLFDLYTSSGFKKSSSSENIEKVVNEPPKIDEALELVNNKLPAIEEKISQVEEHIESKMNVGLKNIEDQMEAFWARLDSTMKMNVASRTESSSTGNIRLEEIEEEPTKANEEPVQIPIAKPRSKLVEIQEPRIKEPSPKFKVNFIQRPKPTMYLTDSSENETVNSFSSQSSKKEKAPAFLVTKPPPKPPKQIKSRPKFGAKAQKPFSIEDEMNLKVELEQLLNERLQEFGVSQEWTGLPKKTYEKISDIIKHRAKLTKKSYHNFDTIRSSIEQSLDGKKSTKVKKSSNKVPMIKNRRIFEDSTNSDSSQTNKLHFDKVIDELKGKSKLMEEEKQLQKGVLKNTSGINSLTKKKVIFDFESGIPDDKIGTKIELLTSSVVMNQESDNDENRAAKGYESLSDLDFSEL